MENNISKTSCKALAIVSGKGGSGKTMVTATMATILDSIGYKVLLIDADYGTAGLTYYMGLNTVANISMGLTNLSSQDIDTHYISKYAQKMSGFDKSRFIGIGDHRRYLRNSNNDDLTFLFENIISQSRKEYDFILIDCRGGIDRESLIVCENIDDIVIVAETDTTSFQATQHLVDTLYDNDLSRKISGFMINKVFDDPSSIARAGTASFKSQYLDSIPFDLDATKSFLVGDLPSINGMFSNQIWHVLNKLEPELKRKPRSRALAFNDYRGLSMRDNESLLGGMMISFSTLGLGSILIYDSFSSVQYDQKLVQYSLFSLVVLSVFSGIEPARKGVGRILTIYKQMITRVFSGKSN